MNESGRFRLSQGFDVLQPRPGRAYPVPCDEWEFLKTKLRQVSGSPWLFHTVGSLLAGAAITTAVRIFTGTQPAISPPHAQVAEWAVVVVSTICSCSCYYFADQQRKLQRVQVSDIITQMELIEGRYQLPDGPIINAAGEEVLTIESAKWGAVGKFLDVTATVVQQLDAGTLRVVADNRLGPDPCYGTPKELVVQYLHSGQRLTKTVKENDVLSLP